MNDNHRHHHTCKYSREQKQKEKNKSRHKRMAYWITGLGSILWLALRTGTKPSRITYPCQQTAVLTSVGFLGYLASITGIAYLYRRASNKAAMITLGLLAMMLSLTVFIANNGPYAYASITALPAWTSDTAISDVFAVENVPIPPCSLDGGSLPSTGACASPSYALKDGGVDALVTEMANRGDYFYKTAVYPTGIVGANDVVVLKINNQWATHGSNRRLSSNSDVLKGTIWRILQHPDGFTGEIVIAENTQEHVDDWNITPANAEDQNQSFQDVVDVFQGLGYPVYLYKLDDLNSNLISGGDISASGYPAGEYIHGNNDDLYIILEDTAGTGTNELSYPKFQTHAGGSYVSMRYGVWNGSSYDADQLTFINMPVLKQHSMAGATIGWKNLIGFITIADTENRYGSWNEMHNFYWGYYSWNFDHDTYGLLGRHFAFIGIPDLNIVDAIWVADSNHSGTGVRQDILLASRDIFAVDWYASEHVLYPIWGTQSASAARSGTFRNATRVNQNSAAANWSGTYPFIDLLDGYNESTPSPDEQNQMNAYVVDASQETAVYALTTHIAGAGSVNLTPPNTDCTADCTESYNEETVVTLTAVYPITSTFTGWSGALNTTTNPITLTMDAAKAVTATFALDSYDLSVAVTGDGDGIVNINMPDVDCTTNCTESYVYGTVVTLTAVYPITSTFTGWSGAINTTTNPITLTMDAAKTVTATFALNELDLTINGNGGGTVNLNPPDINCTADCSETYNEGTVVTLTAVADIPSNSTFMGWSGAINTTTNPITLTMDAAKAVTATFTLNDLILTIAGNGYGTVNLNPPDINCTTNCAETYDDGVMVTLTAVADVPSESTFMGWIGAINTTTNPITLTMDTAKAVTATFKLPTRYFFLPMIMNTDG